MGLENRLFVRREAARRTCAAELTLWLHFSSLSRDVRAGPISDPRAPACEVSARPVPDSLVPDTESASTNLAREQDEPDARRAPDV